MDQYSSDRFQFGKNWLKFLDVLDETRIEYAIQSICKRHVVSFLGRIEWFRGLVRAIKAYFKKHGDKI
tara:strand:+ start:640 stop:843 length:204 start_codon:yes stop_codon:yes gene_type:complete